MSKKSQTIMKFLRSQIRSLSFKNSKSQAAMEFLMTYGWAILIVLVVIAALGFFGVLNPDRWLPPKCELDSVDLLCDKYVANETAVKIYIQNNLGKPLHNFTVTMVRIKDGGGKTKSSFDMNYSYYTTVKTTNLYYTGKGKVFVAEVSGKITGNAVSNLDIPMICSPMYKEIPVRKKQAFTCGYQGMMRNGEECVLNEECTSGYCNTLFGGPYGGAYSGGNTCSTGATGQGCSDGTECASGICTSNICA